MKKLLKKTISSILALSMAAGLFVVADATGDGITSTYPGADKYTRIPTRTYTGNPIAQGNPVITADGTRAIKTDTAAEYLFTAGDDKLIYVDTDSDGNMFVMMEKVNLGIGSTGFTLYDATKDNGEAPVGEEKYFNVNNSWSVASKLNDAEYIEAAIPVAPEYIVDTKWYVETPEETPYYTTCKIALPSTVEMELYNQRIGSWKQSGILDANTLTRSAYFASATAEAGVGITLNYASGNDRLQYGVTDKGSVRPVFFIAKDYFKDVHLDVTAMGTDVKNYILNTFTLDEMQAGNAGYSVTELAQIGYEVGYIDTTSTYPGADKYTTIPKRTYTGNPISAGNPVITADGTKAIQTDTAAEYLFTAGASELVYVDTDMEGNMFVMMENANSGVGSEGFAYYDATKDNGNAPTGEEKYFNVNNSWSVASKLNSAEYKSAFIPVADEYLVDTKWYIETPSETAYYTTCKIALPSVVEMELYNQRIGSWKQAGILDANTLTRSAHFVSATAEPDGGITLNYASGTNRLQYGVQTTKGTVRPVFFIAKDYFKNVHLDVTVMGDSVKEYILARFTSDELKNGAGYTNNELIAIGYDVEPDDEPIPTEAPAVSTYPGADYYKSIPKRLHNGNVIAQGNPVVNADAVQSLKTDTPDEYLFTVGTSELIYVDKDANGNMFVMMEKVNTGTDGAGFGLYDATKDGTTAPQGEEKYFNVNNSWSIASKINSAEYMEEFIPVSESYIVDTDWYVETPEETPYYTTAKIALPSTVELGYYGQRIGSWKQTYVYDANMLTRSVHFENVNAQPGNGITVSYSSTADRLQFGMMANGCSVRPVFFISKDFFIDNYLDVSVMGADVKKYLRDTFTREELAMGTAGYTDEELTAIGYAGEPGATATITADSFMEDSVLTGGYVYIPDATGAEEDKSKVSYQWFECATVDGTYTPISGKTDLTITLSDDQVGKYIKFGVKTGNKDAVMSDYAMSSATVKIEAKPQFEVSVAWKDANGKTLDKVEGATSVKAEFTINNLEEATIKSIIVAVYDEDNKLVDVEFVEEQQIAAGEDTYSVMVDGFTGEAKWSAKAMFWHDMKTLTPIYCTTLN